MADWIFGLGVTLTAGALLWVGYQIGHDYSDRERRLEQQRSWNWYQKYLAKCVDEDRANAERFAAEQAAAVAEVESMLKGAAS